MPDQYDPDCCECCRRRLNPRTMVWLELNCETGTYHLEGSGEVPPESSQGCFTFGKACAERILREQKELSKKETK